MFTYLYVVSYKFTVVINTDTVPGEHQEWGLVEAQWIED